MDRFSGLILIICYGLVGGTDDLYTELWRACAGSSVYVPRVGERVFYFPQGHLEQVLQFSSLSLLPRHSFFQSCLCRSQFYSCFVLTVQQRW